MRKKSKVTIKDIAASLNLSPATVSRALNPEKSSIVGADNLRLIKDKAREMNFIPSLGAAALRTNKSYIIGVVVPDLLNTIFPPLIKGAQKYLQKHGYTAMIINTDNDQKKALEGVGRLLFHQIDGLIMANAFLEDKSVIEVLKHDIPCVLVSRSIAKSHLVHQVLNDEMFGIGLAIDYLTSIGHTHLVHLEGPQNTHQGKHRMDQFKLLCEKSSLQYNIVNSCETSAAYFSVESGFDLMNFYLNQGGQGTAVIASNDLMAIGAIQAARQKNLHVPSDISVLGINNMLFGEFLQPPLTSIAIPYQLMGEYAANILLNDIETPFVTKQRLMVSPNLVIRQSCGPVHKSKKRY